jgi:DNA invertase Pin-like site-specific DNA recombinase
MTVESSGAARVGYTRVSTVSQTLDQQNAALVAAGITKTFSDTMSGARDDRSGLAALLDYVRDGDTVVVWKLDRLGRNTQHVLEVVDRLTSLDVGFRSLTEGLHTDGPMGKAMPTIMAAFAQLERDTMIERTRAGLAAAAVNGRKGGCPRKVDDADAAKARCTAGAALAGALALCALRLLQPADDGDLSRSTTTSGSSVNHPPGRQKRARAGVGTKKVGPKRSW